MITQVGYEIDSKGNVGNETRRVEDLQLRFILLMTVMNVVIDDSELKQRLSEQTVKACHKESGIPISELISLIQRMTKEVKEITDNLDKKMQEWEAA